MVNFEYVAPVQVRFGYGSRDAVGEVAARLGGKALLVVSRSVARGPLFAEFAARHAGVWMETWQDVPPNPTVACVDAMGDRIRRIGAELVIALGGGSVMDAAKAAALVVATGVGVAEFQSGRRPAEGKPLPVIAMPTTAGTASEVTAVSVVTDPARGTKSPIIGPGVRARAALIDPEWTLSAPPALTAAVGVDALSHAMEAYWSRNASPVTDAHAEKAAALIIESLEVAYEHGSDRDAREKMALGSLLAGLAFASARTAAVHACSYPLTQKFGLPHGAACGLTLDAFLRFNAEVLPEKLGRLARVCGFADVESMARALAAMKRHMGLPATSAEAGIRPDQIDDLVAASFHPAILNNPRPVTPEDIKKIYRAMV